jgi:hypothetical protein
MNRLRKFIDENNLYFDEGSRNSTIVVLIGFSQHLRLSLTDVETELQSEIDDDYFIQEELDRLWDYCKNRNYKNYWSTPEAKNKYKF